MRENHKPGFWIFLTGFLVIVFLLSSGLAPVRVWSTQQGIDFAEIDAYVHGEMKAASIPGLAYAVVKDGQVTHMNAFGVHGPGRQPITPQTPFGTGSSAKMWTALAVQQLVQAGKLDLDASVQQSLPWFRVADAQASAKITLRHLIQHQSGFSTAAGNDPLLIRGDPTAEELVRRLANVPLAFEPGSRREYSNLNFILLGVVIEAACGMPFDQYVRKNIFEPLGMRNSYLTAEEARQNGAVQGNRILFGFPVAVQEKMNRAFAAEGVGTFSSAEDMAHFLAALTNGGQYAGVLVLTPPASVNAADVYYDVYWFPIEKASLLPTDSQGHGGATLTYVSEVAYFPAQRLGVVFLTDTNTIESWPGARSGQSIAFSVLYRLGGQASLPAAPTIRSVYLIFDIFLLAILLGVGLHAFRLRGWRERMRRSARARVFLALFLVDFLLPLLMLAFLPFLITSVGGAAQTNPFVGWALLLQIMPDIAGVLLAAALALLATGLVKLAWLAGERSRPPLGNPG